VGLLPGLFAVQTMHIQKRILD